MRQPRIAVIGSGMSGLAVTHYLLRNGFTDVTVYEKGADVGGTWRDNTYPGLTCDVPSRFYQFTFAPNPNWSSLFSPGPEIFQYFRKVAEDQGILPLIQFNTEIVAMSWDGREWTLETAAGEKRTVDFVVAATGILHHPRIPDLPGLSDFAGPVFHSARWDHNVELDDARIGVVGTGSTGVQIVSALAGRAREVVMFQRSPHWVVTVPNMPYPGLVKQAHRAIPALNRVGYLAYRSVFEVFSVGLTTPGVRRRAVDLMSRTSLRAVRDSRLRASLTPSFQPGCRRLIMSPGFMRAVQRDDVRLVTDGIETFTPNGVRAGGEEIPLDVVVLATGFDAHAFMRPTTINGRDGVTLEDAWAEGPTAYQGVALPGFPNLFMAMGPHSPVGNYSLTAVAEAQAGHITRWIDEWAEELFDVIEPTKEATERHNQTMREALPGTVWASGCTSWYLGKDGVPELWPWEPDKYRVMMARPTTSDWIRERYPTSAPEPATVAKPRRRRASAASAG